MTRDRFRRARLAGGQPVVRDSWHETVNRAASVSEAHHKATWAADVKGDPVRFDWPRDICPPGSIAIPMQTVLDIETLLCELQEFAEELKKLANDPDVDEARRQRLLAKLSTARCRVAARLKNPEA